MRATTHRQRAWALALTAALLLSGCASLQPEPVPEPVKEAEAAPVPKAEDPGCRGGQHRDPSRLYPGQQRLLSAGQNHYPG